MNKNAEVLALIKKAADAEKSHESMQFAQAACNAANALAVLDNLKSDNAGAAG